MYEKLISFGFYYINMYRHLYILYIAICLLVSLIGVSLPWLTGEIINVINYIIKM